VGVLEDRDLIAYESKNAVLLIKEIDKAKTVEDLKYLYGLVKEQTLDLVFQGTDPEKTWRIHLGDKRPVYEEGSLCCHEQIGRGALGAF